MILIQERPSKKAVGKNSLFVSFPYDAKLVELVKSAENAIWDKNTHEWELHVDKLSYLIDTLTYHDDISLSFMNTAKENSISQVIKHKTKAFDYQADGIDWLINRESGLLLDMPGLGKSLQVIYAAEELKKQKNIEHCLIICGINTLKQNWKKEIEKFSTEQCRIIGEKINSKGNISYSSVKERAEELFNYIDEFFVIINVESLRDNTVIDAIRSGCNNFDMLVCDEVHKCKSSNSQQGKNLLKLAKIGKYHYGLTGTLLLNSPLDCYVPMKFIGYEKANLTNFKQYYCNFENKYGHFQIVGYKNLDTLKTQLSECSLRRSKDLLNLPPKVIIPEYLEMDSDQANFYTDLQNGIVAEADRVNIKTTSLLGLVTRLRQASTCPEVLTSKDFKNVKLDRAEELVEEITSNNEKVVIFSAFKEPLYQLMARLKDYNPLLCTGDQDDEYISSAIDAFQNDDIHKVILCTASKMGTGITLTQAGYEIFLDTSWTYAEFEQCCDRCYRIGTTKSVTIYNLICKGTIDERVQYLLNQKRGISDYLVDGKYNQDDDLKMLLGIKLGV